MNRRDLRLYFQQPAIFRNKSTATPRIASATVRVLSRRVNKGFLPCRWIIGRLMRALASGCKHNPVSATPGCNWPWATVCSGRRCASAAHQATNMLIPRNPNLPRWRSPSVEPPGISITAQQNSGRARSKQATQDESPWEHPPHVDESDGQESVANRQTIKGPAAVRTAAGEKIARIARLRANIATIVSSRAATATPDDELLAAPSGFAMHSDAASCTVMTDVGILTVSV